MHKSILKITAILVIIALNWSGLSAVIQTIAYLGDTETSTGNTFSAATLGIILTPGSWSPDNKLGEHTITKTVVITKAVGSIDGQYKINYQKTSGDDAFCNAIDLVATKNGGVPAAYTGKLYLFNQNIGNYSDIADNWSFALSLPSGSYGDASCGFDFVFTAWQQDQPTSAQGFSDSKNDSNTVTNGVTCQTWTTESDFNAGTKSNVVVFTDSANGGDGDVKLTSTPSSGTVTLRPNAAGDVKQLSKNGGSDNYDRVAEAGSGDGDTTYVYSSDSAERYDLYNLENTTHTETINSVTVHANMRTVTNPTASSGPNNAGTGTNVDGSGSTGWSNPGNITTTGSPYATADLWLWATSEYLQGTNYGFAIPAGATINGITVAINRKSSSSSNTIRDADVYLLKNGSIVGTNRATSTNWPTSMAVATYGGDLWGTTWTAADINNANFGVALSVSTQSLFSRTASVDYISITVSYIIPAQGRAYIKTNGNEYPLPDTSWSPLTTSYTDYSQTYDKNPKTGLAWTWDEIDVLQAGVSFKDATGGARTTQVWIEVNYSTTTYVASGTITSQQYDKGGITKWTTLEWDKILPSGATSVGTEIRFSNDNLHWSSWYTVPSNFNISNRPSAQYIQWRATLSTSNNTQTPILQEVRACYSQHSTTTLNDIRLNEFLPNPEGVEYGYDFGNDGDSKPKGEWVEIYNNGASSVDLSNWYIQDAGADHTITISSLNTNTGSTIIGPKGSGNEWLVVYMNHAVFSGSSNSSGDTVSLYDIFGAQVDFHTYDTTNKCDLEPTPGGQNDTTAPSPNCSSGIPPNKSYARIPDGTGAWVDPIPTPGRQNILEEIVFEEEQTLEEETIEEITEEEITEEEIVVEEELLIEENQEEGEGIIDEIVDGIVEEILPETEPVGEEPIIEEVIPAEEITNTEETIIEETPSTEEQLSENPPATEAETISAPENNSTDNSDSNASENSGGESSDSDTGTAGADTGAASSDSGASVDSISAAAPGESVSQ